MSECAIDREQLRVGVYGRPVDDLRAVDLHSIQWSGNPAHLRNVAERVAAASRGELDYLAVRALDGTPVAIGAIEYGKRENAGEIGQLSTREDLQGLGLGTRLIKAAEDRIRERGLKWSVLGVEVENVCAAELYARLGYQPYGQEEDSWEVEDADGSVHMHQADVVLMRKELR